jgi:glycosyltransferase involved in cell wall biosynthesis
MEKKKILVIIPDRFIGASGGMGENSAPVFELLADKYEFYAVGFSLAGNEIPSYITKYEEVISPFKKVQSGPVQTIISQIEYFSSAIKMPKPDLIYAYDWSIYYAAVKVADWFDVPLVVRMSNSVIVEADRGITFGLDRKLAPTQAIHNAMCEMEIRGLIRANLIAQISKGYAKFFKKVGNFDNKTVIVQNGIDFKKWQLENFDPYPLPGKNKIKIIFLGRFVTVKGVKNLLDAKLPNEIDLIFIGPSNFAEPKLLKEIKERCEKNNNTFLLESIYGQDKIRALKSCTALVVPSLHEPFGTVGLEGLAAQCIVISSQIDGLGDYLNSENSLYCGTSVAPLENAFSKLLCLTDKEKEILKINGLKTCAEFSLSKTAQKLSEAFEKVL